MKKLFLFLTILAPILCVGQVNLNGKFEQLGSILPSPNSYRTASGAPGSQYWQQRADYVIEAELNDDNQSISGKETITYFNQSPDDLSYLWLQLDQNIRAQDSNTPLVSSSVLSSKMSGKKLLTLGGNPDFKGGFDIKDITDAEGNSIPYFINKTMMRLDLPSTLKSGESISFNIDWFLQYFNILYR